jgi:hypothetical protein
MSLLGPFFFKPQEHMLRKHIVEGVNGTAKITHKEPEKKKKKKGETLETGGPTIAFKNMPLSTQEVFTRYYLQKIPHFPTLLL